jgi:hypothetical protein
MKTNKELQEQILKVYTRDEENDKGSTQVQIISTDVWYN